MTLEANVLADDALRAVPGGYEVDVHLAWYRSLPLSCVEGIQVSIDGQPAAAENLRVIRDGLELRLEDLPERTGDWWFVQDPLTVRVPAKSPRKKGAKAEVSVHLATRIPYIIIAPGKALVQQTRVAKEVVIQ